MELFQRLRKNSLLRLYVHKRTSVTQRQCLMIGILQILGVFLLSTLFMSCMSQPPRYDLYPTLSTKARRADKTKSFDQWTRHFSEELVEMQRNEWIPDIEVLKLTREEIKNEYFNCPEPTDLSSAEFVFKRYFQSKKPENRVHEKDDFNCNLICRRIGSMLDLLDAEHPNLLVEATRLKSLPLANEYELLSLVSGGYPVSVALTRWTGLIQPESKDSGMKKTQDEQMKAKPTLVIRATVEGTDGDKKPKDEKSKEENIKIKPSPIDDFKPEQTVTLTLSTVLNSPAIVDRIDYVSTYVLLQAFPFPPNSDVVLEKEFWGGYCALNADRNPHVKNKNNAILGDMERALEEMSVRIINADTTVKLKDIDFGTLTRKTTDKFSADIGATAAAPPTLSSVTPKIGYSSEVGTDTSMKLQRQLDQRSIYVDPFGRFMRITQRGMQSVNLGGRFVENITLRMPIAQHQFPVLVLSSGKGTEAVKYELRWLSEPLYSRVDALTLSVVVARQTTALAKSTKDSFRLDDPSDAAFIVGVTRPYRITLWENPRDIFEVMSNEISGNLKCMPENPYVFFTIGEGSPAKLALFGFTSEQRQELFSEIRKRVKESPNQPIGLKLDGKFEGIAIGCRDNSNPDNPKLVGFKVKDSTVSTKQGGL